MDKKELEAICRSDKALSRYSEIEVREIVLSDLIRVRCVRRPSLMPTVNGSLASSPLMLVKGNTARNSRIVSIASHLVENTLQPIAGI